MKKALTLLLALVLACGSLLALASCGQEKLVVYTESGFAPFEYVKDGKIVGVDVDIMNKVGEKLGKKVVFENVEFDKIVDAVHDGKLVNVGAAGLSVTEARKKLVDFSTEYYTANLYVIYQKTDAATYETTGLGGDAVKGVLWESLKGKKIAVQNGTTADLFLGDELSDSDDYHGVLYNSGAAKVGFSALASGVADIGLNTDVLIIDELPAKKLIEGKDSLTCAPLFYSGDTPAEAEIACDVYAICVTPGQTELLKAINEVLAELGERGIQNLVNQHLGL